jgi:hypothetical protein
MRQLAALALAGSLIAVVALPGPAAARTCPDDLSSAARCAQSVRGDSPGIAKSLTS